VSTATARPPPEHFLTLIAPFREDVVVAVECIFTWYWLADLCREAGIPFVLGHALYMKAVHGGKAKNDGDAHKIAVLLRGGMIRTRPASTRGRCGPPETSCAVAATALVILHEIQDITARAGQAARQRVPGLQDHGLPPGQLLPLLRSSTTPAGRRRSRSSRGASPICATGSRPRVRR
jgi:hypothetical protein